MIKPQFNFISQSFSIPHFIFHFPKTSLVSNIIIAKNKNKSKDKNKINLWQKNDRCRSFIRTQWFINCNDGKSCRPKTKHKFPKPDIRKVKIPCDSVIVKQWHQRGRAEYQNDTHHQTWNKIPIHKSQNLLVFYDIIIAKKSHNVKLNFCKLNYTYFLINIISK